MRRIVSTIVTNKKQCDKIVIEYDCDGNCDEITNKINSILGDCRIDIVHIPIKFEIEEWICDSIGIKYNSKRRPTKALKDYEKNKGNTYTKDKLPSYLNSLNYERLKQNESFRVFLNLMK